MIEENLIFLISAPRSGSTLLERMLGSHPEIAGGPEPHLMTPLAHLGYFERVDAAPYDPVWAQQGIRALVSRLPGGEADYAAACRAYTDALYGRWLESHPGRSHVLDKTPEYALVLPFIARVYPSARYVVLTRTPLAVLSSYAESFFDGSWEAALRHNPVLDRYVPAIARFLRERGEGERVHVRYEDLVRDPRRELERVFAYLGLPFDESVIEYGKAERAELETAGRGLGDPIAVARHGRPVTASVDRWAAEIAGAPGRAALAEGVIAGLDPEDVRAWGYEPAEILKAIGEARGAPPPGRRPLSLYRLERKALVAVRRRVQRWAWLAALIRRVRLACDLLLR